MRFFDETPIGRIINRFSADQAVLDTEMSRVIGEGSGTAAVVIGSIVSIIAATRGTAMVILLPLGLFYGRVQRLFRRVTTELTRLAAAVRGSARHRARASLARPCTSARRRAFSRGLLLSNRTPHDMRAETDSGGGSPT